MEKKIVRKTTYASKGHDVTLRNTWGHKNSDVSSMPRETESNMQTWSFEIRLWTRPVHRATVNIDLFAMEIQR